ILQIDGGAEDMILVRAILAQQILDFAQHRFGLALHIGFLPAGLAAEINGVPMDDGPAHPASALIALDFHIDFLLPLHWTFLLYPSPPLLATKFYLFPN